MRDIWSNRMPMAVFLAIFMFSPIAGGRVRQRTCRISHTYKPLVVANHFMSRIWALRGMYYRKCLFSASFMLKFVGRKAYPNAGLSVEGLVIGSGQMKMQNCHLLTMCRAQVLSPYEISKYTYRIPAR